ncbi:AMP-binding protein [Pseudomaricurvus alkylphenolicus]|uniref:AMP-binding protein n=1 Tax=Pseudomaricurvus alkylphenolicus TaxID=1306991 RepID=UPI00141E8A02|nr:AMP-binding protein [Pseudomaricurvus alkylphenolicus]
MISYPSALRKFADETPDRTAIICDLKSITFKELDRQSNRMARAYTEQGVAEGDFVSIVLPNGIEFVIAAMACWKLGAIPAPLSPRLPGVELDTLLNLTSPRLVVGLSEQHSNGLKTLAAGFQPRLDLSDAPLPDKVSPHAQALPSGGSTGTPKLIVDGKPAQLDPEVSRWGRKSGSNVLVPGGPLYHSGPFITTTDSLFKGCTVVLMSRFDPELTLRMIEKHRINWIILVPTMMHRIWHLPEAVRDSYNLDSLQVVMSSSAPISINLKQIWIDWLGAEKVYESYGGSERIGSTLISGTEWLAHKGSVGRPAAGTELKILDTHGQEVEAGVIGDVYMRPATGPGSTYSYLGAETTCWDGFETLGDVGYVDTDGYLYLVDRRVDMIVSGGINIYPAEVEAAIESYRGVRSCGVVGLPCEDLGQRVHAIIDSETEIAEPALLKHLEATIAAVKIPRSFEFVGELLRDDAGKICRSRLRQERIQC